MHSHQTSRAFALDVDAPLTLDCPHCGCSAGRDPSDPPAATRYEPSKSHLTYVRERRNVEDGEVILQEALAKLRLP
jgi:hypothetical protein